MTGASNRPPEVEPGPVITWTVEPYTNAPGKYWRFMWTIEADLLHRQLVWAVAERQPGRLHEILGRASEVVRGRMFTDKYDDGIAAAQLVFSLWLDLFAPWGSLKALSALLAHRSHARGWTDAT